MVTVTNPNGESYNRKTRRSHNYPESKKLEVLQAFLALGTLRLAAATCNVPEPTVRLWKTTQWWKDTEAELRVSNHIQVSSRLQKLIGKAMIQLEDRLDNGDYVLTKGGELVRKPISAEHSNKVLTQLIDRQIVVEKAATKEVQSDVGLEARLAKLKQELIAFARKPQLAKAVIESEVIDVEATDGTSGQSPESQETGGQEGTTNIGGTE